ncbi:2-dehydro-3-deoxygalactonokinase [Cognatishimia sp.]|uniref:2-dehydro-3-deoxygalactonokinase n=1 Tax=Cognatishimia sp. TaxID=2211648 RepID=UPI003517DBBD
MTLDKAALVAVDWGTTNLRVAVLDADGVVLDKRSSDKGMGSLAPNEFEPVLLALIDDLLQDGAVLPVICSGMVGARQGWQEAPYAKAPCAASGGASALRVATQDARVDVWILPGVQQDKPADVMRGEETQIAGFLAKFPKFDGVICLPGTHTKWVRISAEEIVSFQTYMTGEMFSLLSGQSVLRHSVGADAMDIAAFHEAVGDAMSRPQAVSSKLFSIRAETLLADLPQETARGRLSGYLLGLELAAARPYWLGMDVALVGDLALCGLYKDALEAQGCPSRIHDVSDLTVAGQWAAYLTIKDKL